MILIHDNKNMLFCFSWFKIDSIIPKESSTFYVSNHKFVCGGCRDLPCYVAREILITRAVCAAKA